MTAEETKELIASEIRDKLSLMPSYGRYGSDVSEVLVIWDGEVIQKISLADCVGN